MKGKKIEAKGKLKVEKEKSARQQARFDNAATNRQRRKEESREREKKAREKFKDEKKVKKAQDKAKAAQVDADARKQKTSDYAKMATSYQSKVASSTGSGTGASDAASAMISNLGSAAKAGIGAVGAVQSKVREVQKQRKADQLAKKAKKREKKFDKKYNEEVFYDWREEFLHEVEKRGDKKEKKIIDVMKGKNQLEFNPVTEGKKDYCDCGCDCGKKICEECGKPHRPENIKEDMKGMSQKSGDKRPTDKGAGMTAKGVAKYNRRTGGNLKTAVTTPPSKLDPDSKAAKRRKSFCARSKGWTGERGKAARRRWNC